MEIIGTYELKKNGDIGILRLTTGEKLMWSCHNRGIIDFDDQDDAVDFFHSLTALGVKLERVGERRNHAATGYAIPHGESDFRSRGNVLATPEALADLQAIYASADRVRHGTRSDGIAFSYHAERRVGQSAWRARTVIKRPEAAVADWGAIGMTFPTFASADNAGRAWLETALNAPVAVAS